MVPIKWSAPALLSSPLAPLFYSSNHCVSQIAGSEACPLDGCPVPSGICGLHLFVVQRWAVRVCSFIKQFCSSAAYPTRFLKHPLFCGYVLSVYLSLSLSFLSVFSECILCFRAHHRLLTIQLTCTCSRNPCNRAYMCKDAHLKEEHTLIHTRTLYTVYCIHKGHLP